MIVQPDVIRIPAGEDGEWIRVYDVARGVTIALMPADPADPPRPRTSAIGGLALGKP